MSSAIERHFLSDNKSPLSTYKKLPPITHDQKMSSKRQVISPASISVDFSPPNSVQSKDLIGGKGNVKKTPESTRSVVHNSGNKRANLSGSGSKLSSKSSGDVAAGQSTNGIELIGYKMMSSQQSLPGEKSVLTQQATDWTPLSSELPPCRICGDKASGLHYGVNTCEACKAFFRRTLKKATVNFQCTCTPEEKLLGTDQPRKTTCAKCRYERCLKAGMSKDAIKIGRYTISRKRQNDQEVKTLKKGEVTDGVRRISESSKSTSSSSPYSTSQSVSSPEELSSDVTSLSLKENKKQPQQQQPQQQQQQLKNRAKKRRHDDEDGLLYQSLTNSIFMSLLNNKDEVLQASQNSPPSVSDQQVPMQATPMEQLLTAGENGIPKSISDTDPFDGDLEVFSPLATILSLYDEQTGLMISPVNTSFPSSMTDDGNSNFSSHQNQSAEVTNINSDINLIGDSLLNGEMPYNSSETLDNSLSNGELHDSHSGTVVNNLLNGEVPLSNSELVMDNLSNNDASNLSLYGINDGEKIIVNHTPAVRNAEEESHIENLFTAPSHTKPYSTILTVTYDNKQSNLTGQNNVNSLPGMLPTHQDIVSGEDHVSGILKGFETEQQIDEECDILNNEFESDAFDATEFIEDLEEIENQNLQLYRFQNPAIVVGHGISVKEAADLIMKLGQAAVVLFDNSKKMTCEEIKKRHADYLEKYTLKTQLFGDMSNISKEEYLEFYNQTGIDIDNRQQILIEALKYMEESVAKLVKFAKAIPGFSDLHIDDQVSLVKVSRFEFEMIKLEKSFGCRKSVYKVTTTPWDKEYHIEEIQKLFPLEFITQKLAKSKEFLQHGLSLEETLVFKALVLTFPASRYEHDMIQFGQIGKCVKSSLNVTTLPWNKEYHVDEIDKIFPKHYCEAKIDNLQSMVNLKLSFEETVVLKALVITIPDRCDLKERDKVENLHNRLIACFLFLLSARPPDKLVRIQSVLGTLFKIRQLAAWDNQIIQEMFEVWPVTSNHQLVKEFVT